MNEVGRKRIKQENENQCYEIKNESYGLQEEEVIINIERENVKQVEQETIPKNEEISKKKSKNGHKKHSRQEEQSNQGVIKSENHQKIGYNSKQRKRFC